MLTRIARIVIIVRDEADSFSVTVLYWDECLLELSSVVGL